MKKHRKLFKYCFLAILCIGLVIAAFYYGVHAKNCGQCQSVVITSGEWQPEVTNVKKRTDGKYNITVELKLNGKADSSGNWLGPKKGGYAWNPNTGDAGTKDFVIGLATSVANYDGAPFAMINRDTGGYYESNSRVCGKASGYKPIQSYNMNTDTDFAGTWWNSGVWTTTIKGVTLSNELKKSDKIYLVISTSVTGDWVYYDKHNGANYHYSGANLTSDVTIMARSGNIKEDFSSCTHSWAWVTDTEATCTADGVQHMYCSKCKKTKKEDTEIDALGHLDAGTRPWDWSETGYHKKFCGRVVGTSTCTHLLERYANTYYINYSAELPSNCTQTIGGSTATTTATYDSNINLPGTGFTLSGYKCSSGWLNTNDTTMATTVKNLTSTHGGNIYLHHHFAPYKYTVYYNMNKPSYATSSGSTQTSQVLTVDSTSDKLSANPFAVTGATFLGWSNVTTGNKKYSAEQRVGNVNGVNANLMLPTADNQSTNLYAIWKPIQYYVQYNSNYNSTGSTQANTTVKKGLFDYGSSYTALKQSETGMSRPGYYIAYWTLNADGTGDRFYSGDVDWPANQNSVKAQFSNLTTVDGATVNLYAHWEPIKYTLTYSSNDSLGGVNPDGTGFVNITDVHYYNEEVTLKKNQWTRQNGLGIPSVFQGWNLSSDANSSDKSIKYTAKWTDCGKFINGDSNPLCTTRNGNITICAVWNDVPELVATDYEIPFYSNSGGSTVGDLISTNDAGESVLSKTALERVLLENAVSRHNDREDGELPLGEHFFIEYFHKPSFEDIEHPTAYEIKYTVVDSKGERYQQSAMLYCGYLIRIDVD